jgi:hypothetical protein
MSRYEMIDQVTAMFALKDCENGFEGLLVPNQDYVWAYNRAALVVYGKVNVSDQQGSFLGCIHSIDDSSAVAHGPTESIEKATKRCQSFKKFIEEHHPMMPSKESFNVWCMINGCSPDIG